MCIYSPYTFSPELEVNFWHFDKYLSEEDEGPPGLIKPSSIISQACRLPILLPGGTAPEEQPTEDNRTKVWVTIGLTRVSTVSVSVSVSVWLFFFTILTSFV